MRYEIIPMKKRFMIETIEKRVNIRVGTFDIMLKNFIGQCKIQ